MIFASIKICRITVVLLAFASFLVQTQSVFACAMMDTMTTDCCCDDEDSSDMMKMDDVPCCEEVANLPEPALDDESTLVKFDFENPWLIAYILTTWPPSGDATIERHFTPSSDPLDQSTLYLQTRRLRV